MVAVAAVAAVAAVLGILNAIIGLFNGLPTTYSGARKLMSDKGEKEGEKKLKKFITYLRSVKRKVREEEKRRINSKCSETSITADVKEALSIVSDGRNKNRLGKRLASKKFIEKLEKSEEAIRQRFREFLSYTRREEATQHTNRTEKQYFDRAANYNVTYGQSSATSIATTTTNTQLGFGKQVTERGKESYAPASQGFQAFGFGKQVTERGKESYAPASQGFQAFGKRERDRNRMAQTY